MYASSAVILKENNCLIVCYNMEIYKEINFFSTEQIRYYKFDLRVHTLINYELNYYIIIILFFFFLNQNSIFGLFFALSLSFKDIGIV
jgi:hypothetical protein